VKKPSIVFLANGGAGSAMAIRAMAFAERLENDFDIEIAYRDEHKIRAISRFLGHLARRRPDLCYVFDMGFSGVIAAALYRLVARRPVVVDTGDAIYELSVSTGKRGVVGLALTWLLERGAFAISDGVVVRSHRHQELLQSKGISADVIPDGVDTEQFHPSDDVELRRKYQLEGYTVVGVLGTLVWSHRWQMCYGWELIEMIHLLRDKPLKGLIIGDGNGVGRLKARCEELGISDRVVFLGRVPYDQLPRVISLMDICLSTQTNDVPGQVRTTGKVPIYLACGRYVLASRVGEAARVLPEEMLLPYAGAKDADYPQRLADRVEKLMERPQALRQHAASMRIAREHFDYRMLAPQLRRTIENALSKRDRGTRPAGISPVPPARPAAIGPGPDRRLKSTANQEE
jgi:glycosyltransferase involved in cell wall biosynthesis